MNGSIKLHPFESGKKGLRGAAPAEIDDASKQVVLELDELQKERTRV